MNIFIETWNSLFASPTQAARAHKARAVLLLAYTLLFFLLTVTSMALLLPDASEIAEGPKSRLPWSRMMLLASLAGCMGGTLHGLASLSAHVGRRDFDRAWSLFYVARPFLGAGMSIFTWLVLSSGIGGFTVSSDLALMAWAALAGLYSQPALDKLRDLFATLFKTESKTSKTAPDGGPKKAGSRAV